MVGPRQDGNFPSTAVGVKGSLSASEKALVLAAMKTCVYDTDDTNAATILAKYTSKLDTTCVAYSGTTSGLSTRARTASCSRARTRLVLARQNGGL